MHGAPFRPKRGRGLFGERIWSDDGGEQAGGAADPLRAYRDSAAEAAAGILKYLHQRAGKHVGPMPATLEREAAAEHP